MLTKLELRELLTEKEDMLRKLKAKQIVNADNVMNYYNTQIDLIKFILEND